MIQRKRLGDAPNPLFNPFGWAMYQVGVLTSPTAQQIADQTYADVLKASRGNTQKAADARAEVLRFAAAQNPASPGVAQQIADYAKTVEQHLLQDFKVVVDAASDATANLIKHGVVEPTITTGISAAAVAGGLAIGGLMLLGWVLKD